MGEGMESDAAIFPFISSANIACGGHAGDEDTMRRSVEGALRNKVAIGAHPSYVDRAHFGRVDSLGEGLRPEDLTAILSDQLDRLQTICREFGTRLHHVKPHGALYNRAAWDSVVSSFICSSIREFDPSLLVYGLSGSQLKTAAETHGLSFVSEVFADRTYREDGSLTPRTELNALIGNPVSAAAQALKMVREGKVTATTGKEIPLTAETICLHGDGSQATGFAYAVREAFRQEGIGIRSPFRR
jgi:5-oxoprolinase (ATP-hydrolysing) subunit A